MMVETKAELLFAQRGEAQILAPHLGHFLLLRLPRHNSTACWSGSNAAVILCRCQI